MEKQPADKNADKVAERENDMLQLGKRQILTVVKKVEFGVYLSEGIESQEKVLLPKKQVPENCEIGDTIDVFLYRDSQGRYISTTTQPYITLGETARLTVKEVSKIGAFLDWGLEKDLLLPFKEQVVKVKEGDTCLVALYIDKSSRLCATMKVYHYLVTPTPYHTGDRVSGVVYDVTQDFGVYVAVDNRYSARIPKKEVFTKMHVGDVVEGRVTQVKPDGKLDLSLREKAYLQMDQDMEAVLRLLEEYDGKLPFTDKASPEIIKEKAALSKNAFKRAVGHLMKEGKVEIVENGIILK